MLPIHTSAVRSVVAIVAAGLLWAAPAARAADDDYDTQSRIVGTHDLDLSSAAGRATLHRRIVMAAVSVCGRDEPHTSKSITEYDQCREQAVADASVQARVLIARAGAAPIAVADARTSRP